MFLQNNNFRSISEFSTKKYIVRFKGENFKNYKLEMEINTLLAFFMTVIITVNADAGESVDIREIDCTDSI